MGRSIVDIASELIQEPRRFSRVPLRAQATITTNHHTISGQVENICLSGALVTASEIVPVGSVITISISGSGTAHALSGLKAKVVRVVEGGMGLQFLHSHG